MTICFVLSKLKSFWTHSETGFSICCRMLKFMYGWRPHICRFSLPFHFNLPAAHLEAILWMWFHLSLPTTLILASLCCCILNHFSVSLWDSDFFFFWCLTQFHLSPQPLVSWSLVVSVSSSALIPTTTPSSHDLPNCWVYISTKKANNNSNISLILPNNKCAQGSAVN